jgi:putative hydrolase of the HAD superfamily
MPAAPRSSRSLVWLFDLDNTLHNASHAIFPAINANMNAYLARLLGENGRPADEATVNAVRIEYWKRYGATLLGMIKHHHIKQEDFLHEAHQFDDLASMIRAERGLAKLFRRLPGRKILLTNAPRRYSHDVMRHLGLHRHFARHIPIESMRVHGQLRPKPSKQFLCKLAAKEGVHASRCVLVEDSLDNLKAAKRIGMRTVWGVQYGPARANTRRPACVDVKVKSVRQLPARLSRLSR